MDEKVTTWKRTYFDVEADSLEEAKQKAISFVEADDHELIPWDDIDGVIPEKMLPEENDNQSTIEIYTPTGEQIYDNGKA